MPHPVKTKPEAAPVIVWCYGTPVKVSVGRVAASMDGGRGREGNRAVRPGRLNRLEV